KRWTSLVMMDSICLLRNEIIPLLAEEGWRASLIEAGAPGWSVRRRCPRSAIEASPYRARASRHPVCALLRSAHPPLPCEQGNCINLRRRSWRGIGREEQHQRDQAGRPLISF